MDRTERRRLARAAKSPPLSYISMTLKGATAAMSPKERALARDCFSHWWQQWDGVRFNDPMSVAFTVHQVVDERVQHMLATSPHGPEVTCRKGCASCCHLRVDVFAQEAVLLRTAAREAGVVVDEARLERQAAATDFQAWAALPVEDRRCVFLGEDRACQVYEHRPVACRKYHVKSDPDLCDADKHPGGEVAIVFSVEAEIIDSAATTAYGGGTMAKMLLEAAR